MFSDGVTEAADLNDEMYGVPRLCEIVAGQQDTPLEQLQQKVVESVEQFARGASQADDITLLFIRYHAASKTADSAA
jgi:sigma-B regulation protein RsbU (phosphoserine phosphatase)